MTRNALIVDDEPDVATYLAAILEDGGWRARTANDANRALELARAEPPDLILLDVMMPSKGGMSTLVALRKDERLQEVPVILVTGIQQTLTEDFEAYLGRFKHYKADAYLAKPVQPEELLETVEKILGAVPGPASV